MVLVLVVHCGAAYEPKTGAVASRLANDFTVLLLLYFTLYTASNENLVDSSISCMHNGEEALRSQPTN
jgi:hypothetical protein